MAIPPVIYLIDDDDVYQYTFVKVLEERLNREQIKIFSDGELALDFIKTHLHEPHLLPDFVFLDINMPMMDGWEFMDAFAPLAARMPKKPDVYMVSSSIDTADMERAHAIDGVKKYLVKPIDLDYLQQLIFHTEG